MAERDLYETLGVARTASTDEIRKTYRKLARKYHPDVNPNDPKAADRFKDISFAHEVLSDEKKRKLYDEFGQQGLAAGFDPDQARAYKRWSENSQRSPFSQGFSSEIDLEELLAGLYGGGAGGFGGPEGAGGGFGGFGGFGGGPRRPRRGFDAEAEVTIDFLDAVRGGKVPLRYDGKTVEVTIPPGAADGMRIRLAGQGGAGGEGAPRGDLYITLRVRPHPFFRREGDDIHVEVPATIPELVLGAKIQVPTPDGPATVTIPAGSNNGRKLRLRGKGALRRGGGRGDLYVTLAAVLPEAKEASTEQLADVAREMAPLYGGRNVREHLGVAA
jgi:curved DNA-binding protein